MYKSIIALLFCAVAINAAEIRLEAEDFKGQSRLSSGDFFSGSGLAGKWRELRTTVEIPEEALYYLWVRYSSNWQTWAKSMGEANARKLRHFEVSCNGEKQLFDADLGSAYGWAVRRIALPQGKVEVELRAVGNDPYVDVVVLTQDYSHVPEPQQHRINGRQAADKIVGRPQLRPARRTLRVPRGQDEVETERFVTRGEGNARYAASVKARHDGQYLYLNYTLEQPPETVYSDNGALWNGDCAELVLDGNSDAQRILHLIVNPAGTTYSEIITPAGTDRTWKPDWRISAGTSAQGWTAEFVVPLAELLRALPEQPGKIRVNFCRMTKSLGEPSSWSPLVGGFADPKGCGELELSDITPREWQALRIPILNRQAAALDLTALPADAGQLAIWRREQQLTRVAQERFAPPQGQLWVFEGMSLLPNPGFEYGTLHNGAVAPYNWSRAAGSGSATVVPVPHSGRHALKIAGTSEDFALTPGTRPFIDSTLTYEWSAWVRGESATGHHALRVVWYLLDTEARGGWGQIKVGGESRLDFVPGPEWQRIALNAVPPKGAVRCEFELLSQNNQGTLYCDDFAFDGMGVQPVDFLLPQPGFDAKAEKKALIWSRQKPDQQYTVRAGGKVVQTGELQSGGISRWKGEVFYADISSLRHPGKYTLTIQAGGQEFISPEFSIEDDLYLHHALLAANFYYVQRQGIDVPGWHKANFLDDAILIDRNSGKVVGHRDLAGGWQDAGDPSKQATADMSIYGLAEFFENTRVVKYELQEKYPDLLALNWWEVSRQINKCYAGEGKFYSFAVNNVSNANWIKNVDVGNFRTKSVYQLDPEHWTDNIPNTADDRFAAYPPALQWMTSGLSKFALSVRPYDQAVAEQIAGIMAEDYLARQERQSTWANDPATRVARGDGELCRIAMHLHQLTGEAQYQADADGYAAEIIKIFDRKIYLSNDFHILTSTWDKWSYYHLAVTLFDYARYYPQSTQLPELRRVLRAFIDQALLARASDNEFGIVSHLFPGPGLRFGAGKDIRYQEGNAGANRSIARFGYLAARAARLFEEDRYLRLADAAAQWIVGRNPKGTSMLIGNGWKFAATSTTLRYSQGHQDGVIPGAVIRGISAQDDAPPDFPTLNVASDPGGNANSNMHEVFQDDTIGFLLVCQELYEARRAR